MTVLRFPDPFTGDTIEEFPAPALAQAEGFAEWLRTAHNASASVSRYGLTGAEVTVVIDGETRRLAVFGGAA